MPSLPVFTRRDIYQSNIPGISLLFHSFSRKRGVTSSRWADVTQSSLEIFRIHLPSEQVHFNMFLAIKVRHGSGLSPIGPQQWEGCFSIWPHTQNLSPNIVSKNKKLSFLSLFDSYICLSFGSKSGGKKVLFIRSPKFLSFEHSSSKMVVPSCDVTLMGTFKS